MTAPHDRAPHFLERLIEEDLKNGKHGGKVITRFPPEPNGFLHLGHAKSICINFGLAQKYQGQCHLRFDDTNPSKEEDRYAKAIAEDVAWLGFSWDDHFYHASDYFEQLFEYAVKLIKMDKAFVCELSNEAMRESRGTLTSPGTDSPWRNRPIDESLKLFEEMRAGKYQDGQYVLRAKIDMASPNMNMRDPIIYRIRHVAHQRTGNDWCIYPMYDFTHCLSDAIEGITHSLCTLEFQDHRPLYDWFVNTVDTPAKPQQTEFARLNVSHTITSKRKLKQLVDEEHVTGWDDPRMPTLAGLRRRGFPPAAIRHFCDQTGASKSDSVIDMSVLEECVRDVLNQEAPRAMAVLKPIKVTISNHDELSVTERSQPCHPNKPELGERKLNLAKSVYIEQDDFMEEPVPKYHRLAPGREVRLRGSYVIRCDEVIKNTAGEIVELICHADPDTLGKKPEGRKVKGVIHWVSADTAVPAQVNLVDRLFNVEHPSADEDFIAHLNPESMVAIEHAMLEPSLADAQIGDSFQFERLGYFVRDREDSNNGQAIFNRVVSLRDTWQ